MPSLSLWELAVGDSRNIVSIRSDTADDAVQRLIDIGFREGQRVSCVMQPGFAVALMAGYLALAWLAAFGVYQLAGILLS